MLIPEAGLSTIITRSRFRAGQVSFTVRKLQQGDIDAVTAAAVEFFHESDQAGVLTVRADKYRAMLQSYLHNPFVASFVCFEDDGTNRESSPNVAGYLHAYVQDDYTDELIGELYQFYVRRPYRGTQAGRMLVDAANRWYEEKGCARAYSEVGHGVSGRTIGEKLFVNLWNKFGYAPKGTVLMKEFQ